VRLARIGTTSKCCRIITTYLDLCISRGYTACDGRGDRPGTRTMTMSDDPILAALARLEAGQNKLRTDFLGELAATRADIMERLDRLQTSTDAIRDDLTVLGGANDAIRRGAGNVRDELGDLARNIGDMQRVLLKHGSRLDQLERRAP
jgi:hypothetical protein